MGSDRRVRADRSVSASSDWHAFARWRAVAYALVVTSVTLTGLAVGTLVGNYNLPAVVETLLAATATGLSLAIGTRSWRASRAWAVESYLVSGFPAVRYQTAAGDYIKFERYDDGVSANWSTDDGPAVLLSIPLAGQALHAQFWTSEYESDELALAQLAADLQRRQSEVIRAWVETDRELVLWRVADTDAAGIAQLGVLMHSWNPQRVAELVKASATAAVQNSLGDRLRAAREWVDSAIRD